MLWQDGVLNGSELSDDAEAAALVAAFQASVGAQLGIDPSRVVVNSVTQANMAGGGRRLQNGEEVTPGKDVLTISYGTLRA